MLLPLLLLLLNGGGDNDAVVKKIQNHQLLECVKALIKGGERRAS